MNMNVSLSMDNRLFSSEKVPDIPKNIFGEPINPIYSQQNEDSIINNKTKQIDDLNNRISDLEEQIKVIKNIHTNHNSNPNYEMVMCKFLMNINNLMEYTPKFMEIQLEHQKQMNHYNIRRCKYEDEEQKYKSDIRYEMLRKQIQKELDEKNNHKKNPYESYVTSSTKHSDFGCDYDKISSDTDVTDS